MISKCIGFFFLFTFLPLQLLQLSFADSGEAIPRTILALYDSLEDQDIRATRIHRLAEMPLNHLGLVVKYHDIQIDLPTMDEMKGIRGILTWLHSEKMPNPQKYIEWAIQAIDEGIQLVVFGNLGIFFDSKDRVTPLPEINRLLGYLGLETDNSWKAITYDVRLVHKDPSMVEFERPFEDIIPPFQKFWLRGKSAKSYLTAGWDKNFKSLSDLVVIGPKGGFVASGFAFFQSKDFQQWYINPFAYFQKTFQTDELPKPDTSTLSGQRIYYSHIDGDGWRNLSEIENYKAMETSSAEVIYNEILKPFVKLPVTVAPIAADLDPEWFGTEKTLELARKIFSLPHVEAGSHTYSHPYFWKYFENYRPQEEWNAFASKAHADDKDVADRYTAMIESMATDPALNFNANEGKDPIPEVYESPRAYNLFPFELEKEIAGSVAFINHLLPPGKKVEVLQWSGDCTPFIKALINTQSIQLANINGGDPRFDPEFPSHSWVSPVGVHVGEQFQVYASASNENTYTELWEDRYFGFQHLVWTLQNTETPRRLKPINIYYHMYSGEKRSSLNALAANLNFVENLEIAPVTASRYSKIAQGFFSARFILEGPGQWRVENRGELQTIRFDNSKDQAVDMNISTGVIGQRVYQESLYVFLDPAWDNPVIALKDNDNPGKLADSETPYLVQGRWWLSNVDISDKDQMSFNAQGYGDGQMIWKFPEAGDYELQLFDEKGIQQTLTESTDSEGILKVNFSPFAIHTVHITIRRM